VNTNIHAGHANALRLMNFKSTLFATHELEKLLDEDMTEEEARELEEVEAIGRRFLAWDLNDETAMDQPPREFVAETLGMTKDD